MRIITVNREFGSGGREIAKRLSDELGFSYFDEEIISEIAKETSLDEKYIKSAVERSISSHFSLSFSSTLHKISAVQNTETAMLYGIQNRIIKEIANNDCVIVGRGADVILAEKNPFKIFVCADKTAKINRCKLRADESEKSLSDKDYERKMKQIDKSRMEYHSMLSSVKWGNPINYNLCINTTDINIKSIIPILKNYIDHFFDESS